MSFLSHIWGCLLRDRKLKKEDWNGLIVRVRKTLEGWLAEFLSLRGRIVLINLVLYVIPLYQTVIYTMPKWFRKKLTEYEENSCGVELDKRIVHTI